MDAQPADPTTPAPTPAPAPLPPTAPRFPDRSPDSAAEPGFRHLAGVLERLDAYVRESIDGGVPVVRYATRDQVAAELDAGRWLPGGGMQPEDLLAFVDRYLANSTRLRHPAFLAHQVGSPHPYSAIAALLNGTLNNGMAVYDMGAPAVVLEQLVVDWLLQKTGWPEHGSAGSGVLTHGGSLANLTALLAARAHADPDAWERGADPRSVLLGPAASHYSLHRAASILGIGRRNVVALPADRFGVIDPDGAAQRLRALLAEGRKVIAVTANACATASGLYDPLEELGLLCRDEGLWLHVDGAHGAAALLCEEHRHHLRGLEHASSLVWDAHKMLETSVLCAAVLFRRAEHRGLAFRQDASYLGTHRDPEHPDLFPFAMECTKTGLGLQLFTVLAARGEAGLADHVRSCFLRTAAFARQLAARPGFHCPYEPQSNILCFRYGDDDGLQLRLRAALLAEGSFHLSTATLDGRPYLRLCVMNSHTDGATIDRLCDRITELARSLGAAAT